jgi:TldD protein
VVEIILLIKGVYMLERWNVEKILTRALKRGGEFADIYCENTINSSISCEEDKIEKIITGRDSGIGIRVLYDYKTAYAYTNNMTEKALLDLADAVSHAVKNGDKHTIPPLEKSGMGSLPIAIDPVKADLKLKTTFTMRGNRTARSLDKRIRQVRVVFSDLCKEFAIANSLGEWKEEKKTSTLYAVHIVAEKNGLLQTAYEPFGGAVGLELFDTISPEAVAESVARRALLMLQARKSPGGTMAVVLSSEAGGTMIHEAVGHGLEADLAQQGLSVYSGKIGEKIASPLITVVDDATIPTKRGTFLNDDEGVAAQKTVLVEKGVLKGFMYDRLTALKDGVPSTGNGRRESYRYKPIPRMTNTLITPHESAPNAIIRSVDKGLFVKKMGGGQVDTVTGNFVFEVAESYIIEGGEVGEPVRGATLTGNGPDVLRCIDMVGNDLGFAIGTCGKDGQGAPVSDAQPTLRIPEIVVGGEVIK